MVRTQPIFRNAPLDRTLDHEIVWGVHYTMRENKLGAARVAPNKSMLKVDKELPQYWKGPLFAYGMRGGAYGDGGPPRRHDLGLQDFRHVVDILRVNHYKATSHQKLYTLGDGEKVQGVQLNCVGDHHISEKATIEPKDVLISVCNSDIELHAMVVEKAGIPLVIRKVPHALAWRDRYIDDIPCPENPWGAMLDLIAAPDTTWPAGIPKDSLRQYLLKYPQKIGSLIIVRKDGQPLRPLLIQGLLQYTLCKAMKVYESPQESDTVANQILRDISSEDLEKWYRDFLQALCKRTSSSLAKLEAKYDIEGVESIQWH